MPEAIVTSAEYAQKLLEERLNGLRREIDHAQHHVAKEQQSIDAKRAERDQLEAEIEAKKKERESLMDEVANGTAALKASQANVIRSLEAREAKANATQEDAETKRLAATLAQQEAAHLFGKVVAIKQDLTASVGSLQSQVESLVKQVTKDLAAIG